MNMRRLMWKTGRRIYMIARGEPRTNLPADSGEIYMQQKVAEAMSGTSAVTVFDIGGNLGQWSTQFLGITQAQGLDPAALTYHVFEPVPATREKLTANLAAAGFGEIAVVNPVAMSDTIGETHINILGSETSGRNSIVDDVLQQETPLDRLTIRTDTLDRFCTEHGIDHVHFIKIDAEGHDFFVLKGGATLMQEERVDVIQFEYTKRWIDSRSFLKDVFALIEKSPYALYRIRPDKLELIQAWHPEAERFFAANYALVHERSAHWFTVHRGSFDHSNTYA